MHRLPTAFAAARALLLVVAGLAAAFAARAADEPTVQLRAGNACLEVFEPQLRVNGARVQVAACAAKPAQLWQAQGPRLVNVAAGRCLELYGPDAGFAGGRIQVADCRNLPQQSWSREGGQLVVQADRRCAEVQPGDGSRVQSADCNGNPAQQWLAEAAAASREVEAGPIWDNADAGRKCPAVCAPQAWTGGWRTTITAQMSVCSCAVATALPPAGPAARAMSAERFEALQGALRAEAFPRGQLGILESAARDNRFSIEQLRRLLAGFSFPSDRVRAVEIVAPRIVDRGNAFLLDGALEFDGEKAQVRAIFDRLK